MSYRSEIITIFPRNIKLDYVYFSNLKKNLIHTILFLNTAFSLIDKMFQQEIINAELKQTHPVSFFLNDIFSSCFPSVLFACSVYSS